MAPSPSGNGQTPYWERLDDGKGEKERSNNLIANVIAYHRKKHGKTK
jgi:hypothetical protein